MFIIDAMKYHDWSNIIFNVFTDDTKNWKKIMIWPNVTQQKCNNNKYYNSIFKYYRDIKFNYVNLYYVIEGRKCMTYVNFYILDEHQV